MALLSKKTKEDIGNCLLKQPPAAGTSFWIALKLQLLSRVKAQGGVGLAIAGCGGEHAVEQEEDFCGSAATINEERGVSDSYGAAPKNCAFHRQKSSSHGLRCKSAVPALCTAERCWVTGYFCYTKKSGPEFWDQIVYMSSYRYSALHLPTNIFSSTSAAIPGHGQNQSPASKFLFTNGILAFCYKPRVLLTVNCQSASFFQPSDFLTQINPRICCSLL